MIFITAENLWFHAKLKNKKNKLLVFWHDRKIIFRDYIIAVGGTSSAGRRKKEAGMLKTVGERKEGRKRGKESEKKTSWKLFSLMIIIMLRLLFRYDYWHAQVLLDFLSQREGKRSMGSMISMRVCKYRARKKMGYHQILKHIRRGGTSSTFKILRSWWDGIVRGHTLTVAIKEEVFWMMKMGHEAKIKIIENIDKRKC
jgi:hypothetical protein